MVEVYSLKCDDEINKEQYDFLLSLISHQRLEQIKKFHFVEDAKRTLFGEAMIRYLACSRMNLQNENICFGKNQYGKPFLYNKPRFFFNVSHSANWVVCAISTKEVGVDIEKLKPIDMKIAKRFFDKREYHYIMSAADFATQVECFYDIWTLKESYVKYIGKGLHIPLNSFCVYKEEQDYKLLSNRLGNRQDICFSKFDFNNNYKLSVCSGKIRHNKIINQIKLVDIVGRLCK